MLTPFIKETANIVYCCFVYAGRLQRMCWELSLVRLSVVRVRCRHGPTG